LVGKLGLMAVSKAFKKVFQFLRFTIESVQQTYQEDSMRNFIDYYTRKIKAENDGHSSFKVRNSFEF